MIFQKLEYRVKNRILLFIGIGVATMIYFLPFSQTREVYLENKTLKDKLVAAEEAPKAIKELQTKSQNYNTILSKTKTDSLKLEELIIDQVSKACQKFGVTLVAFEPPQSFNHADYHLNNRIIRIRGSYKNIVQVVYELETNYPVGHLASIHFMLEEDQWKERANLFAYLYIQNLQDNENKFNQTDL